MRQQGAVLIVYFEALRHEKGDCGKFIKIKQKPMCMECEKVVGIATNTHRVCYHNQQNSHTGERASRKSFKDHRIFAHGLEVVVNPIVDGTWLRTLATLQSLQHWRDVHVGLLRRSMRNVSALLGATAGRQLGNGSSLGSHRYSTIEISKNKKNW